MHLVEVLYLSWCKQCTGNSDLRQTRMLGLLSRSKLVMDSSSKKYNRRSWLEPTLCIQLVPRVSPYLSSFYYNQMWPEIQTFITLERCEDGEVGFQNVSKSICNLILFTIVKSKPLKVVKVCSRKYAYEEAS
jgi:hypothetical protein